VAASAPAGETVAIAATEANIGITLAEQGADAAAEDVLARVLPVLKGGGAAYARITGLAAESLAAVYERTGRPDLARDIRGQTGK
jgi:hypothetical protein